MGEILSKAAPPLHRQVYDQIAVELAGGKMHPGDHLSPERELCERLSVSRVTLRRALKQLEADGLLSRASRGWTVAGALEKAPNELLGFSELARARGLTPTSRVLAAISTPANLDDAELLRIAPGALLIELTRLRLLDGVPTAVDRSRIPESIAPGLLKADLSERSLYHILQADYDIVVWHADYSVEALPATEDVASLLQVDLGASLLVARQTTYDRTGRPVQLARISYRGDRYRFRATLARRERQEPDV